MGNQYFFHQKAYKCLIGQEEVDPIFKKLWKTCCQNKHKVSFWFLLKDRVSTRNILRRRNMVLQNYNCALCSQVEETSVHLFLKCDFAVECWAKLGFFYNQHEDIFSFFRHLRLHLNVPFFLEVSILMCWAIWICRNDKFFKGLHPSPEMCWNIFKKELALLMHRAHSTLIPSLQQ